MQLVDQTSIHKSVRPIALSRLKSLTVRWLMVVFLSVLFSGCSVDLHQQIVTSDDGKFILQVLESAKMDNGASLKLLLNSQIQKDTALVDAMTKGIKLLVAEDVKLIAFYNLEHKYQHEEIGSTDVKALFSRGPQNTQNYLANFSIQREVGVRVLSRVSLYEGNNLELASFGGQLKSTVHQFATHPVFAIFTFVCVALSIAGIAAAIFGKGMKRRWAWVLFSLLGFGVFTTGSSEPNLGIDLLSFVWPSVMVAGYKIVGFGIYLDFSPNSVPSLSPIGLYTSLPLGAIITLAIWDDKRRARQAQ